MFSQRPKSDLWGALKYSTQAVVDLSLSSENTKNESFLAF